MPQHLRLLVTAFMVALGAAMPAAEKPAGLPAGYQLQYQQDFTTAEALDDFTFSDAGVWRLSDGDGKRALELVKQSAYKPPFPSPLNIALVGTKQFGDFVLEAECLQTGKEYGHRDMIFVFGYQNPSQFYYAHVATKTDNVANQIHIVNDKPRTKITEATNPGNQWGLGVWRKIRIERTGPRVSVFFDDLGKPVMTANDATFGTGWVGFGSFDDTGKVANVRIWSKEAVSKRVAPFTPAKPVPTIAPAAPATTPPAPANPPKRLSEKPGPFFESDFPFVHSKIDLTTKDGPLRENFVVRGLVLPLTANVTLAFDQDLLRVAGVWDVPAGKPPVTLMTMAQISYDRWSDKAGGRHPAATGAVLFPTTLKPGGATSLDALRSDPRTKNKEPDFGRGPLPSTHGRFDGVEVCGATAVLRYRLGTTAVREWHEVRTIAGRQVILRHLSVDPGPQLHVTVTTGAWTLAGPRLATGVAPEGGGKNAVATNADTLALSVSDGDLIATFASSTKERRVSLALDPAATGDDQLPSQIGATPPPPVPEKQRRWPQNVTTDVVVDQVQGNGLTLDLIGLPDKNPWQRRIRPADIGFLSPTTAAVVTYDGDVWLISGKLQSPTPGQVTWRRFASGLHESLALSIVAGVVQVATKNGVVRLHDRDGNGEADWYENFCDLMRQSQSTRAFPLDMAMGADGSTYVSEGGIPNGVSGAAAGGDGVTTLGMITRIAPDGRSVETISTGAREPYVTVHPRTGVITGTDQQGHFVPSSVVYMIRPGDRFGFGEEQPEKLTPPLVWLPHTEDNSCASQVWLTGGKFGAFDDRLLHLSYGNGALLLISPDLAAPTPQGAAIPLGIDTRLPLLHARMQPDAAALWLAGFQVYDSRTPTLHGIGRLRPGRTAITQPIAAQSCADGVIIQFAAPLRADSVRAERVAAQSWNYLRSKNYGSGRYRADGSSGMDLVGVAQAVLSKDGRSVFVHLPGLQKPVMQVEVRHAFTFADGTPADGVTYYTIHQPQRVDLAKAGFAGVDLTRTAIVSAKKDEGAPTIESGKNLSLALSCIACHSIDGSTEGKSGPTWKGLSGSKREFADGSSAAATDQYLRESIIDPQRRIVKGFAPGMASYNGVLTEAQIEALILYIRSLQ